MARVVCFGLPFPRKDHSMSEVDESPAEVEESAGQDAAAEEAAGEAADESADESGAEAE